MVTVFSNGLYVTLNNGLVMIPVPVTPAAVVPAELEPPLFGSVPLPAALLLDKLELEGELELELPRGRLPMTLNVTVNGSFLGLLNFTLRASDVSFAVRALSPPSLVLKSHDAPTPVLALSAFATVTVPLAEVILASSNRSGEKIVCVEVFFMLTSYELTPRLDRELAVARLTSEVTGCSTVAATVYDTETTGDRSRPLMRWRT
jgi:hypothetical protein